MGGMISLKKKKIVQQNAILHHLKIFYEEILYRSYRYKRTIFEAQNEAC